MGYKALRHTYGFGVHSPFAFRMVKDVVCPGRIYSWYGYENIDAAAYSGRYPRKIRRQAKMLHRLLVFLNPLSLFIPLGAHPLFFAAVECIDSRMTIERKPKRALECEMISSHGDFLPIDTLKQHIATPGHSLVLMNVPPGWTEKLYEAMPYGLMLHSDENVILVNRPEMMKVSYKIIL
ncbi:MAG: hypothetical protein K2N05_10195 [Muribaculaceae bacterium]|nr:hypothetical protein [Muribaculaceae bacterium]